jgi:hypothetical protein
LGGDIFSQLIVDDEQVPMYISLLATILAVSPPKSIIISSFTDVIVKAQQGEGHWPVDLTDIHLSLDKL